MSLFLDWRTVTHSQSNAFMVVGTVLSRAICGPRHRYEVEEVRCYTGAIKPENADRRYYVRDAESIGDDDIKAGKPMPIVARLDDYDALERFLLSAE